VTGVGLGQHLSVQPGGAAIVFHDYILPELLLPAIGPWWHWCRWADCGLLCAWPCGGRLVPAYPASTTYCCGFVTTGLGYSPLRPPVSSSGSLLPLVQVVWLFLVQECAVVGGVVDFVLVVVFGCNVNI
jgi:hypothetical protein